jgi:two-component system OmpR family response regulator
MEHADHILIVDDDREIRELVSGYLTKNGLRVTVAADGRQMRSFLEADRVDLIVLDVMMPGDDGARALPGAPDGQAQIHADPDADRPE